MKFLVYFTKICAISTLTQCTLPNATDRSTDSSSPSPTVDASLFDAWIVDGSLNDGPSQVESDARTQQADESGDPTCGDDHVSDPWVCANNNRIIVTNQHPQSLSAYVPGCVGRSNESVFICRGSKSMHDEIYAIRFSFSEITGQFRDAEITILANTRDVMTRELDIYRKFDMTISTIAGDFVGVGNGNNPACSKRWRYDGTELRLNAKQFTANNTPPAADQCPLIPGQLYYINIRAASPGCRDDTTGTSPTLCAVEVDPTVPSSIP